jgi:hypothetical protein
MNTRTGPTGLYRMNNNTQWRLVPLYPNYEVSSTGDVRNTITKRPLLPWGHASGHLYVTIGGITRQIHHIVMAAFGPPRPFGQECRHLDGNPLNNSVDNLAWGTRKQNIEDVIRHRGKSPRASITPETADKIRAALDERGPHERGARRLIAAEFGVTIHVVNDIKRGRTYRRAA